MLAIIGGSGLTTLSNLDVSHREVVRTPYGEASGALVFGQICGQPAVFLPRHGYGHTIPPHMVNYRANMWALHHHKVSGVISVASVGSIRPDLQPGDIVLPHQIIDYTWGRKSTMFDGNGTPVTQQLNNFYKARFVLSKILRKTELVHALKINPECDVYLKPECLQKTGSFKIRGA